MKSVGHHTMSEKRDKSPWCESIVLITEKRFFFNLNEATVAG